MTNTEKCEARYKELRGLIGVHLTDIKLGLISHGAGQKTSPTWGRCGDLDKYCGELKELADQLNRRGEYA